MEKIPNNSEVDNTPTGWENMDIRNNTLEPIIDVDDSRTEIKEIEPTPEDYENFTHNYFSELLNALNNPQVNASLEDEQAINDQIAITADLLISTKASESASEQIHSKDVFGNLTDKYTNKSEEGLHRGQEHVAERNHRLANAVSRMEDSFKAYLTQAHPQVEESTPTTGPTLPGDLIE